jgi:hypothetical protein
MQLAVAVNKEPALFAPRSDFGDGALEQASVVRDRDNDLTTRCVHKPPTGYRVVTAATVVRVTERERITRYLDSLSIEP